jgi:hypothetical protein
MFSELFSSVSNVSEAAALYDEALTSLMDAYHSKVSTFATAKSTKTVTLKTKKAVAPAKAVAPVAPKAVAKATSAKKSLAEDTTSTSRTIPTIALSYGETRNL